MGIRELREAFNAVGQPGFVASRALLHMVHVGPVEMTKLTFYGIGPDGVAFEVTSDPLPAGTDVNVAAGQVARKLIEDHEGQGEPPP